MKNKRLLAIVFIVAALVIVTSVLLKQNNVKDSFSIEELKQLMELYGEDSPIVAEYLDKHKNSKELEKQIFTLRNSNQSNSQSREGGMPEGRDGERFKANSSNNKNKSELSKKTSNNQSASIDNNSSSSDYLDDEKSSDELADKNISTNSSGLQALQEMLDNLPSRSNDFLVKLDKDINGLEINTTGREARVSAELLNSDLFENGAFTNAPGIWITGLDKTKDPATYEKLWYDYKNKFIEIPGVGIYLMKDELSDKAFAERKIEILNEFINENPNDNLYEQLAKTYADSGDIAAAEKTINLWSKKSESINYEYEMAEIYRLNGEKSKNNETSQEYLQKAAEYYEQASKSPNSAAKASLPLAKTYEKLGDINSAIRTLENSYDYGKGKIWKDKAAVQLGEYYAKTGDDYSALNWYEKSPAPGYLNKERRGQIYEKLGDSHSAIKNYEDSLKYKRNDKYSPLLRLGKLYSETGDNAKAKETYKRLNSQLDKLTKKRREKIKNYRIYIDFKKSIK
ncbi:tetratricopeptide repeat protein [bacterium]|nr:tetratricopeptide repeat protein [bacterium]